MNLDKRLLKFVKPVRWRYLLALLAGMATALATVGQAWLLARLVGRIFLQHTAAADLTGWLLALALLSLLRAALDWLSNDMVALASGQIKRALRHQLISRLAEKGPLFTTDARSGTLATTLDEGLDRLEVWFRHYLPQLFYAVLIPVLILALVWPLDFISGLVLLFTAPIIPVFMWLIGQQTKQRTDRQWQTLSRMSARFLDIIQGLPTLKLFGRSQDEAKHIATLGDTYRKLTMDVLKVAFLSALVLELAATISTAVIAVEVGLRLLYNRLAFEPALFILILAPEFYIPMRRLGAKFHSGMEGLAAAVPIFEILNTPESTRSADYEPKIYDGRFETIRIEKVNAFYAQTGKTALHNISFQIPAHKITALAGPSGAGKSTVVHLLLRFLDPSAGRIFVDGLDLKELDPQSWRRHISWLPQRPFLFHQTVAENLRLAKPQADLDELVNACRRARLDAFIHTLPKAYDTPIGEQGMRFSGGQAQRLSLARAFLKDAPLLILDEPTAHLDPQLDAELQKTVRELSAGRTVLLIAHRRQTLQIADHLIWLEHGQVKAQGTVQKVLDRYGVWNPSGGGQ